jgi:hypothetical protein
MRGGCAELTNAPAKTLTLVSRTREFAMLILSFPNRETLPVQLGPTGHVLPFENPVLGYLGGSQCWLGRVPAD